MRTRHKFPNGSSRAAAGPVLPGHFYRVFNRLAHPDSWHEIRIVWTQGLPKRHEIVEPICCTTVAPETIASLRGEVRSTPVWWEAFDDEGSWRGRILRNPRPGPCRVDGVSQMSVRTAPWALNLVPQRRARGDRRLHSFIFFTGLCEKDRARAASPAVLAWRHK